MRKQDIDMIDQYLDGTLSEKETTIFEMRLREDKDFCKQFEQFRSIIAGIQMSVISEEIGQVMQLYSFLESGGILLRAGMNENVKFVIERLTIDREWNAILICENYESCTRLINRLVKNYSKRFRVLESTPVFLKASYMAN
jgi:hypothetical protein